MTLPVDSIIEEFCISKGELTINCIENSPLFALPVRILALFASHEQLRDVL